MKVKIRKNPRQVIFATLYTFVIAIGWVVKTFAV